jgi:hypothetical protein
MGTRPLSVQIETIERNPPVKTKIRLLSAVAIATVVASTALADAKSQRKAAEEMLNAMGVEAQMTKAIDIQIEAQAKTAPQLKEPMKKFFDKHTGYASMKEEIITNYAEAFTEKELKEITAFYKTPVGKKLAGKLPELSGKSMELGGKRVMENQAELIKILTDEMSKPKK